MIKKRVALSVLIVLMLLSGGFTSLWAAAQKPLLMSGKSTLFQRVLARPGAQLYAAAGAAEPMRNVKPFTAFYIYGQRVVGKDKWIKVGIDSHGKTMGWVLASKLTPWNQVLTVAFRDPAKHDRVLLFRDRKSLKSLIESNDSNAYHKLYQAAESGRIGTNSPVIAMQPKNHIDIKEDFYLVPIQQHEDIFLGSEQALMLQVTSVPLKLSAPPKQQKERIRAEIQPQTRATQQVKRFRSGLVFVTDATNSMGPYINRTREAVRKVYRSIEQAGLKDEVSFGLVGYRDSLAAVPQLGYLSRTFVSLKEGTTADSFFRGARALKPANVSSQGFVEDAFAGIKRAISELDKSDHAARYIVLITDAGARTADDPLGSTGLNEDELRQLALDKGVSIWVLHLRTTLGQSNHASAAEQYKRISYYPGIGSFYYGVKMGRVKEFGRVLDALASQITQQVREVVTIEAAKAETAQSPKPALVPVKKPEPQINDQLAEFQGKVAKLGYALRMRYLQSDQSNAVPSVFNAWLVDRDFQDPTRSTLDVRVLLTRDQLSDLQYVLKQVLIAAEDGLLSPSNFLNDLKSLSASLSRDPGELRSSTRATGSGSNLADLGYMREYIEDLPYTGEVMNLSLDNWADWPAKRQLEFTHRLEDKINYYQTLHDHTDLWIALDGGPITGDSVFPVALEMLP
ncbi:PpkA [hydrothermal vent metagenome]|uniref:PpkA n=1 Tax=hydrothermal vent metagenome TaxID=652676 RepID=A0A3B1AR13_9ZZZZ